jgi:hypothetical protein
MCPVAGHSCAGESADVFIYDLLQLCESDPANVARRNEFRIGERLAGQTMS